MVKYEQRLDAVFASLSDGARRSMLDRLTAGEATLGQLAEPLDMSLPAVHKHLGVLEAAGLVTCEKRGRERWCRLQHETLGLAEQWVAERRAAWAGRLDALGAYLQTNSGKRRRRRQ